ncbi:zinc finger CCCH domain-containing protein [Musa troglodytarum]|uniref:Zinc finger CCCH domain-containing protein n=1 Tax=Musa troglodytarum TaxID=320322 RepID=A0A9E7HS41_9LILI|nr:zinc finger CCCH domain-containing protein [Musa troglodytarum]
MAALREVKPLEDVAGPQDEEDNNDVDSDECSWEEEEEEEEGELDCDSCGTDDSEEDPTFDVVEETRLALSSIALEKSKSRKTRKGDGENGSDRPLVEIPELDAKDRKCFEVVEKLIKGSEMVVEKESIRFLALWLIAKVMPALGMWFSIASRSATGPPCGTRLVAGRIVKESYGAAKQQHTFTRWDDEENRRKVLQEKHARGSSARFSRDNRIQEKMLKKDRLDRIQKKSSETGGNKGILSQVDPFRAAVVLQQKIQHGQPPLQSLNSADLNFMQETIPKEMPASGPGPHPWMKLDKPTTSKHQSFVVQQHKIQHRQSLQHSLDSVESNDPKQATSFNENLRCDDKTIIIPENHNSFQQGSKQTSGYFPHHEITRRTLQKQNYLPDADQLHLHAECHRQYQPPQQRSHRMQPLVSVNSFHQIPPKRHHPVRNRESCRFYRQGRCYFGEECKYVHDN